MLEMVKKNDNYKDDLGMVGLPQWQAIHNNYYTILYICVLSLSYV